MSKVKQVIVVIKEYADKYRGKMMAQVCHASLGSLLKMFQKEKCEFVSGGAFEPGQPHFRYSVEFNEGSCLDEWLNGIFTKVVLYVETEAELLELVKKLEDETIFPYPIPHALITDSGLTVFHEQPTITCLGIGPWNSDEIDKVTKDLKVLK